MQHPRHHHVSRLAPRFTRAVIAATLALGLTSVSALGPAPTAMAMPATPSRITVTLSDDITPAERSAVIERLGEAGATIAHEFRSVLPGIVIEIDGDIDREITKTLDDLTTAGLIDHVEREQPITVAATRSDVPWGLDRIDQRVGTDGTFTPAGSGAGVRVYLLDSGVTAHPDLGGRIADGINLMPDQPPTDVTDGNGHGTHIAGIITGSTLGIASSATVVPVRVLDDNGGGTTTGVITGLDWVLATHPAGTPGIVNLSLDAGPSPAIDDAVNTVLDAGLAVVVAAGNNAVDACGISPARVPRVITVGAATHDATTDIDRRAAFSNHGPCLDLFAPGTGIRSTWIDGGTHLMSGTSIAAPHVTGALAALWSDDPGLSAVTVTARLLGTVTVGAVLDAGTGSPPDLLHLTASATPTPRSTPTPPTAGSSLPARVADTRSGLGGVPTSRVGAVTGGGAPLAVPVLGRAGIPASGVAAVTVNITVTDTITGVHGGYVTAYPCGTVVPNVSTLNFTTGETVANAAIVPVGDGGAICADVFGSAHVIVDVTGHLPTVGADGVGFVPVAPTRRADTRSGIGGVPVTPISGYTMLRVPMLGHAGIAASGAAAAVNITATGTLAPVEGGYVTAFPCSAGLPGVSTLNFTTGDTVANAAIVPLSGPTNTTGEICVFVYGRADILVDVTGYMVGSSTMPGAYVPVTPTRRADTRSGIGGVPVGPVGGSTILRLPMSGRSGLPADGASTVALNITATGTVAPAEGGYITVYPCSAGLPDMSTLNFTTGETVANAAIVPLGTATTSGELCVFVHGRAQIIVDVTGYIA